MMSRFQRLRSLTHFRSKRTRLSGGCDHKSEQCYWPMTRSRKKTVKNQHFVNAFFYDSIREKFFGMSFGRNQVSLFFGCSFSTLVFAYAQHTHFKVGGGIEKEPSHGEADIRTTLKWRKNFNNSLRIWWNEVMVIECRSIQWDEVINSRDRWEFQGMSYCG